MTAIRLGSISAQGRTAVNRRRAGAIGAVEVTPLEPGPGLAAALAAADPDIVHFHGEPGSALARRVARLCESQSRALLLETDGGGAAPLGRRAHETVARASAAIGRSPGEIAALRRAGLRGAGVVALPDVEPASGLAGPEARLRLDIDPQARLVVGWCGAEDDPAQALDLLEALALSRHGAVGVLAPLRHHDQVLDTADALELLPRVRVTEGTAWLRGADILVVGAGRSARARARTVHLAAEAVGLGLPVVHGPASGLGPLLGAAGWSVPDRDPVLLARLLDRLADQPEHLEAAATATEAVAGESAGLFAHAVLAAGERPRPAPRHHDWLSAAWREWTRRPLAKRP